MSTRILVEFNTDFWHDWPEEIQFMVRDAIDVRHGHLSKQGRGVAMKWERHHTDPCPVEHYAEEKGFDDVVRT